MAIEVEPGVVFGKKAWHGPAGFIGGVLLIVAGALCFFYLKLNARGALKLPLALGFLGLTALAGSFHIQGLCLLAEGLRIWRYWYWFVGEHRLVAPDEIERVVLSSEGEKYIVCLRLNDGTSERVPAAWTAVKDAQAVINFCETVYGVPAGVEIEDANLLEQAASFAGATRWTVKPGKALRKTGERLLFQNAAGEHMGELAIWRRMFRASRAEIADGPGDLEANGPRWIVLDRCCSSRLRVRDGENDCNDVRGSIWNNNRYWVDPSGVYWSAVFESNESSRTPFTLRIFRGLPDKVGSNAERADAVAKQGEAVLVALADGPAEAFTVDVSDESAWPWVRVALAAVWLKCRPTFTAKR